MKRLFLFLLILLTSWTFAQQKPAFWDDVQHFKTLNKEQPPQKGTILFLGSSSFTMWQDVNDYFPSKNIVNRAFGGSSLLDLNFYSEELLKPYQPRQIVIYCGENDFAGNPKLKPSKALNRFKHFYRDIRKYYPNINVSYVSIKMSPSRENLWPKFVATNHLIKNFLAKQPNTSYIDITKAMEDGSGNVRRDIFLEDMLHMKPDGYRLWAKEIAPYLK